MRFGFLLAVATSLLASGAYATSITVDIYTRSFDNSKGGEFNEHANGTMTLDNRTLTIEPKGRGPAGSGKKNGAATYDAVNDTLAITRGGGKTNH